MLGQWEVVGKKKGKDGSSHKKPDKHVDIKKIHKNTPTIEEVLPLQHVKNLYNSSKNKENQKPQIKPKHRENSVKKYQKKSELLQASPKSKSLKSIESALNTINIKELQTIIEDRQSLFPDAPLVWLKDIVKYLSQHIPVDISDPTFTKHPDGYPFSIVPTPVRSIVEKSIKDAGKGSSQVFYDLLLTIMTDDMSKNIHTLGSKFYIQYLAITEPNFVTTNLNKHISLRTSYQNRPPIGLSILWALGQAGIKDFNAGLKVFEEIMLPIIEMKNYSRYIVRYLISLINRHENAHISVDQYLLILDVAFANYKNVPNDLKQDFQKVIPKLEKMLISINKKDKLHVYVETLFKKLLSNNTKAYKDDICKVLVRCFMQDENGISSWTKLYPKCLPQSAIVLNYMSEKWNSLSVRIDKTVLNHLLNTFSGTNEELSTKKRKESGLIDCITANKRLKNKMVTKKKSKGFPYKMCILILIFAIMGIVYHDIRSHGAWQRSRTFNYLKDYGIVEHCYVLANRIKDGLHWLHLKVDEQVPGYYEKVSEQAAPYGQLVKELLIIFCNIFHNTRETILKNYPQVFALIEQYVPGLLEQSKTTFIQMWSTSIFYFTRTVHYLKTEVFVGQLAPDNLQKVVLEVFNNTQQKAVECYQWIYEKVQSNIK